MRLSALALLAVAIPALGAEHSGSEQWVRLTTPHFELYTTAGEKSGRQAILYFEQVRSFFTQVAPVSGLTEFPVRIIVFKSEKQYNPYAWNEVAFAYFTASKDRNYIVMQDAEPEHFPTAIHEYMDLIVNQSRLKLPLWLNEGWADVYSTLKPLGDEATIGELIPRHVRELLQEQWLSFDTLTSVDKKSPVYNEKQRAGIFYAESWALVHMLYLAPDYKSNFPAFVNTMLQEKTVNEAAQAAYGRSAGQVYADLKSYLLRNQIFGAVFPVKLAKSEEEARSSPVSPFESELALADLLATINKRDQAQAAYENPSRTPIRPNLLRHPMAFEPRPLDRGQHARPRAFRRHNHPRHRTTRIEAALTAAKVFRQDSKSFMNLTLYEQRLQRTQKEALRQLQELQTKRVAARQRALDEAVDLRNQHKMKGEPCTGPDSNQFVFATTEIEQEAHRQKRRADAQNARSHHYNLAAYRESPLQQAA